MTTMDAPYRPLAELLAMIPGAVGERVRGLYAVHADRFSRSPGSSAAHQAWEDGTGYLGHVADCCNLAVRMYASLDACRPLPFALADLLLVLALHDLEKPWKYVPLEPEGIEMETPEGRVTLDGAALERLLRSKAGRRRFREDLLRTHGIVLTPEQQNGLTYVEGEGDDYTPGERTMGPLAAMAHAVDVLSARLWHAFPSLDDPWPGAALHGRQCPDAGLRGSAAPVP